MGPGAHMIRSAQQIPIQSVRPKMADGRFTRSRIAPLVDDKKPVPRAYAIQIEVLDRRGFRQTALGSAFYAKALPTGLNGRTRIAAAGAG